jgi:hypothetical protein
MIQQSFFHHSSEERFEQFHAKNPAVYRMLCERARELKARGLREYSMRTLWEVLRWHSQMNIKSTDEFKLNDHYAPFYARKIMENEPDLRGFFSTREQGRKRRERKEGIGRQRNEQAQDSNRYTD